jgi:archaellum component FlaC
VTGQIDFNINFWVLAFSLASLFFSLINFTINRHKAASNELKEVKEAAHAENDKLASKLDDCMQRLARAEAKISESPTHSDIGKIYDKLNEMNTGFSRLIGEFTQVSNQISRLYDVQLKE